MNSGITEPIPQKQASHGKLTVQCKRTNAQLLQTTLNNLYHIIDRLELASKTYINTIKSDFYFR